MTSLVSNPNLPPESEGPAPNYNLEEEKKDYYEKRKEREDFVRTRENYNQKLKEHKEFIRSRRDYEDARGYAEGGLVQQPRLAILKAYLTDKFSQLDKSLDAEPTKNWFKKLGNVIRERHPVIFGQAFDPIPPTDEAKAKTEADDAAFAAEHEAQVNAQKRLDLIMEDTTKWARARNENEAKAKTEAAALQAEITAQIQADKDRFLQGQTDLGQGQTSEYTEPTSGWSKALNFILATMGGGILHPDYGKQIYYGEENNPNKMAEGGLVDRLPTDIDIETPAPVPLAFTPGSSAGSESQDTPLPNYNLEEDKKDFYAKQKERQDLVRVRENYAKGGLVNRRLREGKSPPNAGVADDLPRNLSEGEYVIPKRIVDHFGEKFFEELLETIPPPRKMRGQLRA
jgi:hypothetical protein